MIKVTNGAPKQLTVFFGKGTIQVGTVESAKDNLIGVLLLESAETREIGSIGKLPFVQDCPMNTQHLTTRSVILSFPKDCVKSVDILIDALQEIKEEIIAKMAEGEETK